MLLFTATPPAGHRPSVLRTSAAPAALLPEAAGAVPASQSGSDPLTCPVHASQSGSGPLTCPVHAGMTVQLIGPDPFMQA